MIPLTIDVPMKRLPWVNWALILSTVAVSLAVPSVKETVEVIPEPGRHGQQGALIIQSHAQYSSLVLQRDHFKPYQLATALFQHVDLLHLLGNMLFLFVFGNAINAKLGHALFLVAYFAIGVVVNLVWWLLGGGPALVGASAAIMGMCGMFLVLYPRNSVTILWDDLLMIWATRGWTIELPGWVVVICYFVFDLWGVVFHPDSEVGHLYHVIGAILGFGLALALLGAGWLTADTGEQTLLQWLGGNGPVERSRQDSWA